MPDSEKRNFIIGIIVVAIAILFAIWWILAPIFGWTKPSVGTNQQYGVVMNVPLNQLPQDFPSNTPFLAATQTDQSFNVDYATSTIAGQKYISSMPLLQVFDLYQQFFSQTGWTLSNFVVGDVATVGASFDATKGNDSVNIKLLVNPKNQSQTQVYITYTVAK